MDDFNFFRGQLHKKTRRSKKMRIIFGQRDLPPCVSKFLSVTNVNEILRSLDVITQIYAFNGDGQYYRMLLINRIRELDPSIDIS